MIKIVTVLALVITAVSIYLINTEGFSTEQEAELSDDLKFSNTQEWDPVLKKVLDESTNDPQTIAYLAAISLPPPPTNTSAETRDELKWLHELENTKRHHALSEIEAEVQTKNLQLGDFIYGNNNKPATTELLEEARKQVLPVLMTLKQDFDRVRPSHLDPNLSIAINLPRHPAYPSGHATEGQLIAILLSKLDPVNAAYYQTDAIRIAENREIAGVHYPSDSEAGRSLADQFAPLFLESPTGKRLFEAAATEWR